MIDGTETQEHRSLEASGSRQYRSQWGKHVPVRRLPLTVEARLVRRRAVSGKVRAGTEIPEVG